MCETRRASERASERRKKKYCNFIGNLPVGFDMNVKPNAHLAQKKRKKRIYEICIHSENTIRYMGLPLLLHIFFYFFFTCRHSFTHAHPANCLLYAALCIADKMNREAHGILSYGRKDIISFVCLKCVFAFGYSFSFFFFFFFWLFNSLDSVFHSDESMHLPIQQSESPRPPVVRWCAMMRNHKIN